MNYIITINEEEYMNRDTTEKQAAKEFHTLCSYHSKANIKVFESFYNRKLGVMSYDGHKKYYAEGYKKWA